MTARIFPLVPVMVLTLATATALARSTVRPFAQFNQAGLMRYNTLPYVAGDLVAVNAAFVGDGSTPGYLKEQQQLTHEPGYSVGTGAAKVSGTL